MCRSESKLILFTQYLKGAAKQRKLILGLWNAGSLGTHHDELIIAMQSHDVDLLAIFKLLPMRTSRRALGDIDQKLFKGHLEGLGWRSIWELCDVNEMLSLFNRYLTDIFDVHAPVKSILLRYRQYPWLTYNIKLMMKRRDEAWARARISDRIEHKVFYKDMKRCVEQAIVREKKAYFDQYINKKSNNPSVVWSHIKNMCA